jgi:endogenous inhibitor of DNA gyrase (YacG/DUF329 family)
MPAKPPEGVGPGQGGAKEDAKGAKPCPICGKPATEASRPFCSERCRDVDLNRWLSNSYAIPGRNDEDEDAE